MAKLRKASISTSIALIVMLTSMLFQGTSASAARSSAASLSPTPRAGQSDPGFTAGRSGARRRGYLEQAGHG
jgi:hypothetical protein